MTNRWLVYDIGTTGTKAAMIDQHRVVEAIAHTYATHFADGGIAEQSADDWWDAFTKCTHALTHKNDIDGIILTGQMQDLILLDEQARTIRPVILYSDQRAHQEATHVNEKIGRNDLRQVTGNFQDAGSLLAKLLWLKTHEPQILDQAKHLVFGAADFIVARLTGLFATDTTTASTTGLVNIHGRTFLNSTIWEELGLGEVERLLPKLVDGGTHIGGLQASIAQDLQLPVDLPVYLAAGDAGSATIGAGCGEIGTAYAYVGTSGWVAYTAQEAGDPERGVITILHPRAGHYIQVAPMMTAGGNLDWLKGIFQADSHDLVIEEALAQKPSNLLYLPYLNGERSPFSDPFARGSFIGLSAKTTRADMQRAVLEGVIFAYHHILDALAPEPLTHLIMTGGGTRSLQWCQLFADIIGIPIQITADAENVGLRGAIQCVAVNEGISESFRGEDVAILHELMPNQTDALFYQQKYALFKDAYQVLKPLFESLTLEG